MAENEKSRIPDYFVTTSAYTEALDAADYVLFIGRKGTGKTANLLMLEETIGSDDGNHVCKIDPANYDFEGILDIFGMSKSRADRGYLVNAIWKFLVYTELAFSVAQDIELERYSDEQDGEISGFLEYVAANEDLIEGGFADRLESALRRICNMEIFAGTREEKLKVSEDTSF